MNELLLSVVSHGQGGMVNDLLTDIGRHAPNTDVLLTRNVPEQILVDAGGLKQLRQVNNEESRGFGENHNAAFLSCDKPFYCITNPDVRLANNPFPDLLSCMEDPKVGLVAPKVVTSTGYIENSARYFPTPISLVAKAFGLSSERYPIEDQVPTAVDWVAGMFMLFRSQAFQQIGGFDERFFLYYEDVDICVRLWRAGWKVVLHPDIYVIHDAQRTSRRNPKYMGWHLASMARYLVKHTGRLSDLRFDL